MKLFIVIGEGACRPVPQQMLPALPQPLYEILHLAMQHLFTGALDLMRGRLPLPRQVVVHNEPIMVLANWLTQPRNALLHRFQFLGHFGNIGARFNGLWIKSFRLSVDCDIKYKAYQFQIAVQELAQ